jgi:hypothetical protein
MRQYKIKLNCIDDSHHAEYETQHTDVLLTDFTIHFVEITFN